MLAASGASSPSVTPVLSRRVWSSLPRSEGDYGAGQMGALWDKFKRLKLERDTGAGSKRPFSYSLPEAAVLREGSYRLAAVPCRAMPCHAVPCHAMPRRGLTGERWVAASRLRLVFLLPRRRGAASSGHMLRRCSRAPSPARCPPQCLPPPALSSRQSLLPGKGSVRALQPGCFDCK